VVGGISSSRHRAGRRSADCSTRSCFGWQPAL